VAEVKYESMLCSAPKAAFFAKNQEPEKHNKTGLYMLFLTLIRQSHIHRATMIKNTSPWGRQYIDWGAYFNQIRAPFFLVEKDKKL
jgi:hypothetical protein